MAIKLGERVLDALVTCTSGAIGAELSLGLTAPTKYYKYRRALAKDPAVYFECWVDDITNVNVPSSYTIAGNRHSCEVQCSCRITYINRAGVSPDQSHIDGNRYAAALSRVFLKNAQLGAGPEVQFCRPERYTPSESRIDDAGMGHTVNQVTVNLTVSLEETYL